MNSHDRVAAYPALDWEELSLYRNVLMDVRGGPWTSRIHPEIGPASLPLYDALFDRVEARLRMGGADRYEIDELDWTAIRCLVPTVLTLHSDGDFYLSTGYTFDISGPSVKRL